ncbi:MAG: 3-hydroxyacyl-CoA dehydrogenase NAD-binding domain-containing protein, partial [Actinomycetota bacterium]
MDRSAAIGVLGQGYVGLTVACAAADAGFPVTGIDIDEARIEDLRRGTLSVPGVLEEDFRSALATG